MDSFDTATVEQVVIKNFFILNLIKIDQKLNEDELIDSSWSIPVLV